MVEYYLTCPKKLNVQNFSEPVQKITMCPKSFGQVQNILDAFKKF
jgi:hypothetical protein